MAEGSNNPEKLEEVLEDSGIDIFNAYLPSSTLFHSTCEHGFENRAAGAEERTVSTKSLFTYEDFDVRHLPIDGGSPELVAPSQIHGYVDEVGNRTYKFGVESDDKRTR